MCVHLLGNRDEAQDALQEVYVQVWHHAGEYHADRGTPLTWMMSICRYRCLDVLRKRQREAGGDNMINSLQCERPGPMQNAMASIDRHRLNDCLRDLDEGYRTSIEMAYFRGLSHQQLAQAMGQPLGTAKSWLRRGLDTLRRCLSQ
ncbi:ECF subfamily RNA polymerase sigma-24 subunit [Alcanivorax hongdengensis A-11-3]|uniref:ECF subfamily RNA polymerase sigma-24 subunit n=2 Tax=Alcanivorax hongdengensis TaxID=519051 RepID=L0WG13_9GAMM|nr:ECF subfamily RNA polymerase sigma-24 subunit [Alcanivorax hongdengensis A-11-3]